MKCNFLNFSQKQDGFLLIEALVALTILTCFVKAIVSMHAGLFALQKSVTNRIHILQCASNRLERARRDHLLQGSRPSLHDEIDSKKCCSVVYNVVPVNFVVEHKGGAEFNKKKISLPCHHLVLQDNVSHEKNRFLELING